MAENAGDLVMPSLRADPAAIGALRLDISSADADYSQQLRNAFYGDVDPAIAEAAMALLTRFSTRLVLGSHSASLVMLVM